jgi:NAD(P)-dependent dehydrogenase (short-subunit alcohol dehydrogenase family)
MMAQERGQIVNISSIYANAGIEGAGVCSATKAAVTAMSDSLRIEAKGKIKVTTVKPTGVPGINLAGSVVNLEAVVELTGRREQHYLETLGRFINGSLTSEERPQLDPLLGDHPGRTGAGGRPRHRPALGHQHQRHHRPGERGRLRLLSLLFNLCAL